MRLLIESAKNKSGIYKIVNLINGKVYVGSAINLYKRYYHHVGDLRYGKHPNDKLTKAVNKYGLDNFSFELLEFCNKECLLEREQYWIDYYDAIKNGYNIALQAGNSTGLYGFKVIQKDNAGNIINTFASIQECAAFYSVKEKTIVLQSFGISKNKYNLYIDKDFFPAWLTNGICKHCKSGFIYAKSRNRIFCSRQCYVEGKYQHSPEIRQQMSKSLTGKKVSEETKRKISAANKGHGRKQSEETKLKISVTTKGRRPSDACLRALAEYNKSDRFQPSMLGKKHSIETRMKMSETAKKKKLKYDS